ncbi:MAG TPA: hypothetical protein VGD88_00410 [Opitutaceae bacterium]
MKWIIAAIVGVAVAVFALWPREEIKTAYVNGLPEYNHLPGQEFIFQRDCYIFKFTDKDSSWPLVGAKATVPALPAEVTPANIGASIPGVRILGVVRVGERFKIASVRRQESKSGTSVSFELLFMDEPRREEPRMDAFWILDHTPETKGLPPTIREDYAVARIKA